MFDSPLSINEILVAELIALGFSDAKIAVRLNMTVGGVKQMEMHAKHGAVNRRHLVGVLSEFIYRAWDTEDEAYQHNRESLILQLVAEGKTNAEIGAVFGQGSGYGGTQVWRTGEALGIHSRQELVREAERRGLTRNAVRRWPKLSLRQGQVAQLLLEDLGISDIARRLGVAPMYVQKRIFPSLLRRYEVSDRRALIAVVVLSGVYSEQYSSDYPESFVPPGKVVKPPKKLNYWSLGPIGRLIFQQQEEVPVGCPLTGMQRDVVELRVAGYSIGETAGLLHCVKATVMKRLAEARETLGVDDNDTVIREAQKRGWVQAVPRQELVPKVKPPCFEEVLSSREQEIVSLIGKGLSNMAIAEHLQLSPSNVRCSVSRACKKLDVLGRQGLEVALGIWGANSTNDNGGEVL